MDVAEFMEIRVPGPPPRIPPRPFPAPPGPPPRLNREDMLRDFRRNNILDFLNVENRRRDRQPCKCDICDTEILCKEFLAHLDECASINNASKELKSMVYHKFHSTDYCLLEFLYKLRFNCEVDFYDAFLDSSKIFGMPCSGCSSFEAHLRGDCLAASMNNVYRVEAELFAAKIMAHHEQYLYLKKQAGLETILDRHNAYYDTIEHCLTDDSPADIETEHQRHFLWYEFRKNTIDQQTAEKNTYIMEANSQMRTAYDNKNTTVRSKLRDTLNRMKHAITANKRIHNNEIVRQMLAIARGTANVPEYMQYARRDRRNPFVLDNEEPRAMLDHAIMDADEEEIALHQNDQA